MRINFDSLFKDIKRLVDSPAKANVKEPTSSGFQDILASISPRFKEKLSQIETLPPKSVRPETEDPALEEAHARLSNNRLRILELELQPLIPSEIPNDKTSEGVKTPTIVDARRIEREADSFAGLKHSERVEKVRTLIEEVGLEQGINPALSMAVVAQESSFDHNAVSSDGFSSKGLFQLLDSTGHTLLERSNIEKEYNPFDPKLNVQLGVSYLRYLHEIFSKDTALPNELKTIPAANSSSLEKLAVAAFNAGEGRVASAQARAVRRGNDPSRYEDIAPYLPDSTREYVMRVLRYKREFEQKFQG
ncbi:MAG: transglycosylase SLT domain-containing protein [Deltaproteobacteria bacterium]|nr:transglycosylase SLT domain-containing protein [Deltaproteobacteria bacterium]